MRLREALAASNCGRIIKRQCGAPDVTYDSITSDWTKITFIEGETDLFIPVITKTKKKYTEDMRCHIYYGGAMICYDKTDDCVRDAYAKLPNIVHEDIPCTVTYELEIDDE